ncbi:Uncharacterised protein [Streptococcus pyogenes]|uniref:hypothetical protein n=1 Tax=Streptococcus pyogenes TaxID=1314 RepID=UPI00109CE902|nr:hypothetical protein [Streptococcus pyogenes]VGX83758.1 Uncharacterised protein [Streptococcus pyogenes]VGX84822.1 Uncharacterised protein [Streptococcus pyogenes]VHE67852.1 Uncharacterised protein [Streptococcus pyogenes]VHH52616.1 Uncharacterised protein [Streptococcus pyogenes]VHI23430.1 Uncharacterised protein [Streptococcus pyogenes]
MKTKSKVLSKLGIMCLAIFIVSAALLTTSSVKAESFSNVADDFDITVFDKAKEDGYEKGFDDGVKADSSTPEEHHKKQQTPYTGTQYDTDYWDAYDGGFADGWRKGHPVKATLEWLWQVITSWFKY